MVLMTSWGCNLRTVIRKCSHSNRTLSVWTCNGWGSGCLASPLGTTVRSDSGTFSSMWSRNHAYSKLREPALGRAIPFAKFPEFRTREKTSVLISLLQVVNKTDTRVLWFSVKKISKKKEVFLCVLVNFMTSLKFEKNDFCQNKKCAFWIFGKNTKNSLSFRFFFVIG